MKIIGVEYSAHLDLVNDLAKDWNIDLSLRQSELKQIYRVVEKVASGLGVWDIQSKVPVNLNTYKYQFDVLKEAFDGATKHYIPQTYKQYIPSKIVSIEPEKGIYKALVQNKANLNTVNEEDAIKLPGLGKVSAQKLLSYRSQGNLFLDWEEVKSATGISTSAIHRLRSESFLGEELSDDMISSDYLEIQEFGVAKLIELIEDGQIRWLENTSIETPFDLLLNILHELSSSIMANDVYSKFWVPSISRLSRNTDYFISIEEKDEVLPPYIDGVSYVYGSKYLDLLKYLFQNATERIQISMFFFYVEESGPGKDLLNLLKSAQDRGVAVQIVLDQDLEGDYHNARNVNKNAFEEMTAMGINYRTSYPDRTNHTKLICVDDYIVCGSHNLTASSFYRYEDTSFIVDSKEFAQETSARLQRYFEMLDEDTRIIYLEDLDYLKTKEIVAFKDLGFISSMDIIGEIRTTPKRENFATDSIFDTDRLHILYRILNWMITVKISETTAYQLSNKSLYKIKDLEKLENEEFRDLSLLDEPFKYRSLASGILNHLKSLG